MLSPVWGFWFSRRATLGSRFRSLELGVSPFEGCSSYPPVENGGPVDSVWTPEGASGVSAYRLVKCFWEVLKDFRVG